MLEYVLNSEQRVSILRLLVNRPEWVFSLSEISRELKIPKNTASRSLKPLVYYSILREFKKGKGTVFQLNGNNNIVKEMLRPLFYNEREYPLKKARGFCQALKKTILVGVVFGSASKGTMTPTSDIDIALISKNPKLSETLAERMELRYLKEEGLIFSVRIFRPEEFKRRYAAKDPHIVDIANGTVVFGDIEQVI